MASNGLNSHGLSSQQSRAVAALLATHTVAEAAEVSGIGARTLSRWLADAGFRLALQRAQDEAIDATVRRLALGSGRALDTLEGVMDDASLPASVRVRAALGWLDARLRWAELADIERRLSVLEVAHVSRS